jgi:hypothetical protein
MHSGRETAAALIKNAPAAAFSYDDLLKKMRSGRGRLFQLGGMVGGLATVAGLAVGGAAAASTRSPVAAHGASGHRTPGPKPTIVLVHGSWANGSSCNGVVQRLQADGITEVKAPHLSMIAAPGVVTQVILKAVHATG